MAMIKTGNAIVTTPIVDPGKWLDKKTPASRVKVAQAKISAFDPSKWLLSHVSIMASVDVDTADYGACKKSQRNFLIKPEYSIFVNNNGDSWERNLLKAASKSFLGANNYVEHVQLSELSKGKVIDVALREVPFTKKYGKDLTTLYVDILLATDRSHTDLIDKIISGEYQYTSMGCLIKYSQCSQCGNIAEDDSQACKHVRFFKNNHFYDPNGVKRIIAELCGRSEETDSCKFIDASWVRKPAFEGAALRNILDIGNDNQDVSEKIKNVINIPGFIPQEGMLLKAASDAANDLVTKIAEEPSGDAGGGEAPPPDDTNFPEPSGGDTPPLSEDSPPAEEEAPPAEGGGAEAPAPGAEAPAPDVQEPIDDATTKEVKDMLKKQVLNQIRKELLQEEAKKEERPVGLENEVNESLARDASEYIYKEETLRKIVSSAKRYNNEKFINGIYILSNLKNWNQMKRYGYTRNDVLGLLYHIDRTVSKSPLQKDSVNALKNIRLASNNLKGFFTEMIIEIGRKPNTEEARKLAGWGKILSNFD